jgi:hypothetical protein
MESKRAGRSRQSAGALTLIVQHDVEQRTVNLKRSIVLDELRFAKFVHEETDF